MQIRERVLADRVSVQALLTESELPLDGLELARGWVAIADGRIAGHVAVEEFGESVILRSLVVAPDARGQGIARTLLLHAEQESIGRTLYLRTRTINAWVERLGYKTIAVEFVPETLKASAEFGGSICASVPVYCKQIPVTVLFACIHNAGRSQMAAAWFNQLADRERACAISAGTEPAEHVHAVVLEAMREVGIDLVSVTPRKLTAELAAEATLLITMGCGEKCPYVPGLEIRDWPLPDPKGQGIATVRQTRDAIRAQVEGLLAELRLAP